LKIHAVGSRPNYWRHVRPIFKALPVELRGEVLDGTQPRTQRIDRDDVFLIGGYSDLATAGGRRTIYIEHGAGQTYNGTRRHHRAHYPGGEHPDNVIGYICPNEIVAESWGRPAIAVGCPALASVGSRRGGWIVVTFHFDAPFVSPEARSARPHYLDDLHHIVTWVREECWSNKVLGHAHPRDHRAAGIWKMLDVPFEPDPDEALRKADLVLADNTSFAYEAAALGIPNVALNAPWYRREVEHGLRFWEHPPGLMVDDAWGLMKHEVTDWIDNEENHAIRKRAVKRAYGETAFAGGARRAAKFIVDLVG
jgi:hypothetical protein